MMCHLLYDVLNQMPLNNCSNLAVLYVRTPRNPWDRDLLSVWHRRTTLCQCL